MADLFSGLESLGLSNLDDMQLYEEDKKETQEDTSGERDEEKDFELEVILNKSIECPCCYTSFRYKAVRAGKLKIMEPDSDLRPRYEKVDALKYDAIVFQIYCII